MFEDNKNDLLMDLENPIAEIPASVEVYFGIDPEQIPMVISTDMILGRYLDELAKCSGQESRMYQYLAVSLEQPGGGQPEHLMLSGYNLGEGEEPEGEFDEGSHFPDKPPGALLTIGHLYEVLRDSPEFTCVSLDHMYDCRRQLDEDLRKSKEGSSHRGMVVLLSVLSSALFIMGNPKGRMGVGEAAILAALAISNVVVVMFICSKLHVHSCYATLDRPFQSVWNSREIAQREADVEAAGYEAPNAEVPDAAP